MDIMTTFKADAVSGNALAEKSEPSRITIQRPGSGQRQMLSAGPWEHLVATRDLMSISDKWPHGKVGWGTCVATQKSWLQQSINC